MTKHIQLGKTAVQPSRYPVVDMARGAAIMLMFVYHFAFDLHYYGAVTIDFNHDPFWLGLRTLIVSLFLAVAGVSLHLATAGGINKRAFTRRLLQVAGCAGLVSMASYVMFPKSMIFFGILHFIAVASVLGLLFHRLFWLNLALGLGLIVAGLTFQHVWFDQPGWQWVGFMTHKPITEDYVPLIPWFGVVLIGLFMGKWIFRCAWMHKCRNGTMPESGQRNTVPPFVRRQEKKPFARLLAFGGRHSLPIYMLHQPLLFAVLYLFIGN